MWSSLRLASILAVVIVAACSSSSSGGAAGSDTSGGGSAGNETPQILNHCQAVLACSAYTSNGTEIYAGDIQIVPYSPHSCATAMVTSSTQRPGELFLAVEFGDDHSVVNHDPTIPSAPTSPWSGDENMLTFGWDELPFKCVKDNPSNLTCQQSGHVCTNRNFCCSGVCGPDSTGKGAVCL